MKRPGAYVGLLMLAGLLMVIPAANGAETGSISGVVTIEGEPVADLPLEVELKGDSPFLAYATTGADGSYTAEELPDGDYVVSFCVPDCGPNVDPGSPPLSEWYDNAFVRSDATPVVVLGGMAVVGIDADLTHGGSLSGRVGDLHGGVGGVVEVYRLDGVMVAEETSESSSGLWTIGRLISGAYKVRFLDGDPRFVDENNWFSGQTAFAVADVVHVVDAETTSDIDFLVSTSGTIAGTVYGDNLDPLAGIEVELIDVDDGFLHAVLTDGAGRYMFDDVPAGVYSVLAIDPLGLHTDTWYPDSPRESGSHVSIFTDQRGMVTGKDIFMPVSATPAGFVDISNSIFKTDIAWMVAQGITKGCNPPTNDRYCPSGSVTRGQMAAFLVRALGLTDRLVDPFIDDDSSVFQADIERLAAAGITRGCNPPANDRFCPDRSVTRGQMAAFLVRALGYIDNGGGDTFGDDDDSIFEADIDRLAAAGVTKGCNPPANDRFCPTEYVVRGQMAAFLYRALSDR